MIRIFKLAERVVDPSMSSNVEAQQIKLHILKVGHGTGNIDFSREILRMEDAEYNAIVEKCDEYGRFKLGNLNTYFEIDIYPEHAARLLPEMPECRLREELVNLKEGFLTIKKYDD
ncbi:MAG TPA: formate hydrogenlyase maturation HycH family protein [Spirochaetota bacterium]|nr:formate hydrogenlyase maturation HycH family protein [Spirochaetota bacterium]HPJ36553.1 formate hydrogenlyase maturation HycH family protein [Spirochaetota bacterium]